MNDCFGSSTRSHQICIEKAVTGSDIPNRKILQVKSAQCPIKPWASTDCFAFSETISTQVIQMTLEFKKNCQHQGKLKSRIFHSLYIWLVFNYKILVKTWTVIELAWCVQPNWLNTPHFNSHRDWYDDLASVFWK